MHLAWATTRWLVRLLLLQYLLKKLLRLANSKQLRCFFRNSKNERISTYLVGIRFFCRLTTF